MTIRAGELPLALRLLAAPAGLLPLGSVLTHGLRALAQRRPDVFDRLGEFRKTRFVIAPTDLVLSFIVIPDGRSAVVTVGSWMTDGDVVVRAPILHLLGLLDGSLDGDALFFDRCLEVSGRTDALLALRNAVEAAELRPSDLLGLGGPLAGPLDRNLRALVAALQARFETSARV